MSSSAIFIFPNVFIDIYEHILLYLFKSAIQFAKESTDISDYNSSLINQAWKTLLFNEHTLWVKKEDDK